MRQQIWCVAAIGFVSLSGQLSRGQERLTRDQQRFFESKIRPVLVEHCYECHSAKSDEVGGKLLLDTREGIRAGGESGPAIEAGKPEASLLLQRIKAGEMPPGQVKVSAREIAVLEKWIAGGAKTARAEPAEIGKGLGITDEERSFWAFRPVTRPAVPISNFKIGRAHV